MIDIPKKLITIIANYLCIDKTIIKLSDRFENDLGADSLDMIELLMAIEDEFNITVNDEETIMIDTVEKAIKLVESKV